MLTPYDYKYTNIEYDRVGVVVVSKTGDTTNYSLTAIGVCELFTDTDMTQSLKNHDLLNFQLIEQ